VVTPPAAFRRGLARRWRDLLSCAVLVLLWVAVWIPRLRGPIDLRWDASAYYILGTALAEGKGYRLLNEPEEIEAVQYPPLLPLIVAAQERALGSVDYLPVGSRLRLLFFVLSGVYLLAAYAVLRLFLAPPYALLGTALTAFSFESFLHPSDALYAELPFALTSMLFLLCHLRGGWRGSGVAAGVLGAAAYLLRTAGIALLAAWVAESLLRRQFRQALVRGMVAAVPVLLWQSHVWRVTASEQYRRPAYSYQRAPYYYANVSYAENGRLADPFRPELGNSRPSDLPRRVLWNLMAVPGALGESTWVSSSSPDWFREKVRTRLGLELPPNRLVADFLIVLGGVIVVGAALFAVSKRSFLPLYFGLTIALISLTPWPGQFWRYLAPLTPISALFLIHALLAAGARLARGGTSWGRTAGSFVVTVPLAGMLIVSCMVAGSFLRNVPTVRHSDAHGNALTYRPLIYGGDWQVLDPALEWLSRHAGPGAVIASAVPHMTYLRTGHRAVLPPMETDPDRALRLMDEVPVSYVLLDEFDEPGISRRYAEPAIEHTSAGWRLVYATPGGGARVYERLR
jgi:hypothetical protein